MRFSEICRSKGPAGQFFDEGELAGALEVFGVVAAEGSGGEAWTFEAGQVGYGVRFGLGCEALNGVEGDFSEFGFQGGVVAGTGEEDQDVGFEGVDFVAEEALLYLVDFGDFGPGAIGYYGTADIDLE